MGEVTSNRPSVQCQGRSTKRMGCIPRPSTAGPQFLFLF